MPINRFYLDTFFYEDEELAIQDSELHHLAHVVRTEEGETVDLVNGRGQLANAVVKRIEKKKALLVPKKVTTIPAPNFKSILVQAIPRFNRLDTIVEKGTELGMTELWLLPTSNSEKKDLFEKQMDKLKAIAVGAMKQCGRLYLPSIQLVSALNKWNTLPKNSFFGDLASGAPKLIEEWLRSKPEQEAHFFIGPESGFTDGEIARLTALGAKGVGLHHNILRTDTAAIAALAIVSQLIDR